MTAGTVSQFTTYEYGIAIINADGSVAGRNYDQVFETASSIKSAIGTLAIFNAEEAGHDLKSYTMTIGPDHASNGSGLLKNARLSLPQFISDDQRASKSTCVASLEALLELNIVMSDCMATNALIDYVGGKDSVNVGLSKRLGLDTMRLFTERLNFPGVDHEITPFQVGSSNMLDMAQYYARVWPAHNRGAPTSRAHNWYQSMHSINIRNWLFPNSESLDDTDLFHKTGSAVDTTGDQFYATFVDAGMLHEGSRLRYVAAAVTAYKRSSTEGTEEDQVRTDFAQRNIHALNTMQVVEREPEAA